MSVQLPSRCADLLSQGLTEMDVECTENQRKQLLEFLSLMHKWNSAYNLTAVRDPQEMVARHLLDSVSLLPYLVGERILDVGTGPGLPGLPLAILYPDRQFTLLDSNGKKIRFVRQVILELGLENAMAEQQRVELFRPETPFQTITARAFAGLSKIVEMTQHLLAPGGHILAMKGVATTTEKELEMVVGVKAETVRLEIPILDEERHLIILETC